jgi:hypothetical protein
MEYRVFTVDRDAHLVSYRKFTCKDDAEAIIWAKQLIDRFPVELWNDDRLVIRLEPTKTPVK